MKIQLPQGQAIAGPGLVPVMTAIPAVTTVMACGAEEWAHFRYPSLCPFCGTAHGRLPEWPKGAVCKTVGSAYVGSNPTPATTCENGPLAANSRLCGPFLLCPAMCHLVALRAAVSRCPRTYSGRDSCPGAVGAHRRLFHGRPRTGRAGGVLWLDVRR